MRARKTVYIPVVVGVAAVFASSVHSCIARRHEFDLYPTAGGFPSLPGDIRVLLVDGGTCTVSVSGGYRVTSGGKVLFRDSRPMPQVLLKPLPAGMAMGNEHIRQRRVEVFPEADGTFCINGSAYRGRLLITRSDDGLTAVNRLPLDDYLASVVSSEMPSYWPMTALEAQAITARTYVLYRARRRATWHYDVTAGTGDQVYQGIAGEASSARRAVDQTRGVVLLYDWQMLPAYYHSTCGGRTAARETVFGELDITPLSGVACKYCDPKIHGLKGPRYYRWQAAVSEAELLQALAADGREMERIEGVKTLEPDLGGHARHVLVEPSMGNAFTLSVDELRSLLGPGTLKSNCFQCDKHGTTFVFRGRGFGHGVGMCQWGARGMALEGYSAKAILQYYYPGAQIRRVY